MQTEREPAGRRGELRILETSGEPRGFRGERAPDQWPALHRDRDLAGWIQRCQRAHRAGYLGAAWDVFETWIRLQRYRRRVGPGAAEKLHA